MSESDNKKRGIGGISRQYASIGGRSVQPSKRSDAEQAEPLASQMPERLAVGTSKHLDAEQAEPFALQTPERSDALTSERFDGKASKRSDAQKVKRLKRTVYLDPDVDRWIRHRIADTYEDISDVINDGVRRLM